MSPIIEHPDVARMLMTMKALTQGARAICYSCAEALDMARVCEGDEAKAWSERASLITPIAKAFSTDIGLEVASLGVQVHGGMGFIEETGAARLLRDARIAPIYEGTNGIQAIDLVMRKLPLSGGETVKAFIADFKADAEAARASNAPALEGVAEKLDQAIANLESVTAYMQSALADGRQTDALTGATPYLRLFGLTATTAMLVRGALADTGAPEAQGRAALARFAAASLAPETNGLAASATAGASALADASAALV
jgi:acyl-CoA dehydrogenase